MSCRGGFSPLDNEVAVHGFPHPVCIYAIPDVTEGRTLTTRVCAAIGFLHPEVGKLQMRSWVGPYIMDERDLLSGERVTTSRLRAGRADAYCIPQNQQKEEGGKNTEEPQPGNDSSSLDTLVWKFECWLGDWQAESLLSDTRAADRALSTNLSSQRLASCLAKMMGYTACLGSISPFPRSILWDTLGVLDSIQQSSLCFVFLTHLETPLSGLVFWSLRVCPQISTSVQRAWSSATTTPTVSTCPAGTTASAEVVSMTMAPTCWMAAPASVSTRWTVGVGQDSSLSDLAGSRLLLASPVYEQTKK